MVCLNLIIYLLEKQYIVINNTTIGKTFQKISSFEKQMCVYLNDKISF